MDKSLILSEIKKYLNFKTDSDFAHFLGIKQNTLSMWKSRNIMDYDLIISKCENINANWLLTGNGPMIRSGNGGDPLASCRSEVDRLHGLLSEKDRQIASLLEQQEKLIGKLTE